jgi:NAD(P)-dependent dehydrogenase (short-subunit alcohol dehydrogenase family)
VFGQIAEIKAALPLIRATGTGGRIVIIGSIGGRLATPLLGPYDASKHALEAIAESLRHELRPAGIGVSLIEPGAIATPMWDKARDTADEMERTLPPEAIARYQWAIDGVRKGMEMQTRNAVPADKVAAAVERALTSARPRARTLVGVDARAMAALARFAPDAVRDFAVRFATKP